MNDIYVPNSLIVLLFFVFSFIILIINKKVKEIEDRVKSIEESK